MGLREFEDEVKRRLRYRLHGQATVADQRNISQRRRGLDLFQRKVGERTDRFQINRYPAIIVNGGIGIGGADDLGYSYHAGFFAGIIIEQTKKTAESI